MDDPMIRTVYYLPVCNQYLLFSIYTCTKSKRKSTHIKVTIKQQNQNHTYVCNDITTYTAAQYRTHKTYLSASTTTTYCCLQVQHYYV